MGGAGGWGKESQEKTLLHGAFSGQARERGRRPAVFVALEAL